MKRSFRQLEAWKEAVEYGLDIYRITKAFPPHETYGLSAQMREAAVSIPSNIAEGQGRGSDKEWCRFLYIARGSLAELETQLVFAERLSYISPESTAHIAERSERVGRILNGLIQYVKRRCG